MKNITKKFLLAMSFLLMLLFTTPANAAYLQGDDEINNDYKEVYPPPQIYIPPKIYLPPRYNDFYSFVSSLSVVSDSPISYNGLSIFLISGGGDYYIQSESRNIITLEDAYRNGVIRINEYDNGIVSKVWVDNYSASHIFLMAGEIISGGKQTRTIVRDFLVAPYARNAAVDVYCIEEGRWDDRPKIFTPAEPMLDSRIRGKVLREEGQDKVWSGIREYEKNSREYSNTHNLFEVYKKRGADSGLEREIGRIIDRFPYSAIGMVVTRKDQILGVEAFYSHELFMKQFDKLYRSYYYAEVGGWFYRNVTGNDVQNFLSSLKESRLTEETAYSGVGRLYDVSVNGYYGSALDFGGIIHLSMIK